MRNFVLLMLASAGLALGCLGTPRARTGASGPAAAANNTKPTTQPTNNTKQAPFWAKDKDEPATKPAPLSIPAPGTTSNPSEPDRTSANPQPTADYNGMLAGSLVDSFNRQVPRAYVQVLPADGTGRAVEMAVENGYFVIPGLTPGRAYVLTARTVDGERKLAGRVQAIPPNGRVIIRLSEDLYSSTVPLSPPNIDPDANGPRIGRPIPDPSSPASRTDGVPDSDGWKPDSVPAGAVAPAVPPPPLPPDSAAPPPPPLDLPPSDDDRIPPLNTENIADRDKDKGPRRDGPPIISIPNNPPPAPLPEPDPVPRNDVAPLPPPPTPAAPAPAAPAPRTSNAPFQASCVLAGQNRLANLSLRDVYGQPWEFRQAQGRYILLDFFGTWCGPCMREIPHIKKLHEEYGPLGLEVIGIACENQPTDIAQENVLDVIQKKQINYRVLLVEGQNTRNPVVQKFQIGEYPTLILLDRTGQIVWRSGKHNPPSMQSIDQVLPRLLRGR